MTDGKIRRAFPYRIILSSLMGVVILYLAVTFVLQTSVSLELRDKLGHLEQEIATAEKANSGLKARLDYVSSNDAAEEWARENGWARPDEVLVVVLAPSAEASPGDQLHQDEEVRPASNRDSWWDLFFGER
jgi:cell division protein FtsB